MQQNARAKDHSTTGPARLIRIAAVALVGLALTTQTLRANPSDLCLASARTASQETGVPLPLLIAISQTETGRRRNGHTEPWPWTVNMEGEGHWFESRDAALRFAAAGRERGARSFDVGCFQLNYRWHGANFASLEAMFDPDANALYAATFLSRLHAELGDWGLAAGAYHSRTESLAARYRARVEGHLAEVDLAQVQTAPSLLARPGGRPRENAFPLLRAGAGAGLGSLVPLNGGG